MPLGIFDKPVFAEDSFAPDSAIYAANDSIGGERNLAITGTANACGILISAMVADNEGIGAAGALWIFKDVLATPITDNNAFGLAFADYANLLTVVTLDSYTTTSSFKHSLTRVDEPPLLHWPKGFLKYYFVPSGTPDWATTKLIYVRLGILSQ